jgi:hypothetical protein
MQTGGRPHGNPLLMVIETIVLHNTMKHWFENYCKDYRNAHQSNPIMPGSDSAASF